MIAVNPKEYFDKYRDRETNKKHKLLRKRMAGMPFEIYTQRIMYPNKFHSRKTIKTKKAIQKRFQVKNTNMQMVTVKKNAVCWLKL